METNKSKVRIIFPELSYKIVGILYDVHNQLGHGYHEKYYQRAVEKALEEAGIHFKREQHIPLEFRGRSIGRHFVDFVIEGKIVLELKVANKILPKDLRQVLMYLRSTGLPLGIVAAFARDGLIYRRVLNRDVLPPISDNSETIRKDS